MKLQVLMLSLAAACAPVMAAQYVANGDWAPTRKEACDQATALAMARTASPMKASSCICDKGDKRFSCLATIEVIEAGDAIAQEAASNSSDISSAAKP